MHLSGPGRGQRHHARPVGPGARDAAQPLPGGRQRRHRVRVPGTAQCECQLREPLGDVVQGARLADVDDDDRNPFLQVLGGVRVQPVDLAVAVADGDHEVRVPPQQRVHVQVVTRAAVVHGVQRQRPGFGTVGGGAVVP